MVGRADLLNALANMAEGIARRKFERGADTAARVGHVPFAGRQLGQAMTDLDQAKAFTRVAEQCRQDAAR